MSEHKAAQGHANLERALARLERALASRADDEFRLEIVVKLFEIAYELSWKTLRQDLANDGRIVGSPHAVFVAVYDSGWIEDDQVWFDMINDRNVTVHTYRQDEIEAVVSRVPSYLLAMRAVHDLLKRDF